jgi:putative FmdB family regulatory protein
MPTYAYRCAQCGATFEEMQALSEHESARPRCPHCGSEKVEARLSMFYAKTSKKS